ncbi:Protein kinase domain containing protein [Diplonema papillatum]|nr:Protein kinase domain containing protein [Diplonema papillatum]
MAEIPELSMVCAGDTIDGMGQNKEYEKIRTVGRGSFGKAMLCRKKSSDGSSVDVVVKRIELPKMDHGQADTRSKMKVLKVQREVNVLSRLSHQNIIEFYDVWKTSHAIYISMEYAASGDLEKLKQYYRSRSKCISEDHLRGITNQVASALNFLHGQNILHRDVKSSNIFLTRDGVVKLGDFGLVKELQGSELATTQVGTPAYMSPEVVERKPYDAACDVWSLGVLLYELAYFRYPFVAPSLPELHKLILKAEVHHPKKEAAAHVRPHNECSTPVSSSATASDLLDSPTPRNAVFTPRSPRTPSRRNEQVATPTTNSPATGDVASFEGHRTPACRPWLSPTFGTPETPSTTADAENAARTPADCTGRRKEIPPPTFQWAFAPARPSGNTIRFDGRSFASPTCSTTLSETIETVPGIASIPPAKHASRAYSTCFRTLVNKLLTKDPSLRLTAEGVLNLLSTAPRKKSCKTADDMKKKKNQRHTSIKTAAPPPENSAGCSQISGKGSRDEVLCQPTNAPSSFRTYGSDSQMEHPSTAGVANLATTGPADAGTDHFFDAAVAAFNSNYRTSQNVLHATESLPAPYHKLFIMQRVRCEEDAHRDTVASKSPREADPHVHEQELEIASLLNEQRCKFEGYAQDPVLPRHASDMRGAFASYRGVDQWPAEAESDDCNAFSEYAIGDSQMVHDAANAEAYPSQVFMRSEYPEFVDGRQPLFNTYTAETHPPAVFPGAFPHRADYPDFARFAASEFADRRGRQLYHITEGAHPSEADRPNYHPNGHPELAVSEFSNEGQNLPCDECAQGQEILHDGHNRVSWVRAFSPRNNGSVYSDDPQERFDTIQYAPRNLAWCHSYCAHPVGEHDDLHNFGPQLPWHDRGVGHEQAQQYMAHPAFNEPTEQNPTHEFYPSKHPHEHESFDLNVPDYDPGLPPPLIEPHEK